MLISCTNQHKIIVLLYPDKWIPKLSQPANILFFY